MKNVAFIAPIWNYHPILLHSLITQRINCWELFLVHDGPAYDSYKFIGSLNGIHEAYKEKIHFIETEERRGDFGHPIRQEFMKKMLDGEIAEDCDWLVITNADNYHMPAFCDALLGPLKNPNKLVASYCSHMIHNYFGWTEMKCKLEVGNIDIAALMFRKEQACKIGWNHMHHSADWSFIDEVIKMYGPDTFYEVAGNLVVHN